MLGDHKFFLWRGAWGSCTLRRTCVAATMTHEGVIISLRALVRLWCFSLISCFLDHQHMHFVIGALHIKGRPGNRFNNTPKKKWQKHRNPKKHNSTDHRILPMCPEHAKKTFWFSMGDGWKHTKPNHEFHRRGVSKKQQLGQNHRTTPYIYIYIYIYRQLLRINVRMK